MKSETQPSLRQILASMHASMGSIPIAMKKAAQVDAGLVYEHLRSRGYAMPLEQPALDEETRTLIYLAAALAASNHACIAAMANKAKVQGIPPEKLRETLHIVRLALATRVLGDAEPVLDVLQQAQNNRREEGPAPSLLAPTLNPCHLRRRRASEQEKG